MLEREPPVPSTNGLPDAVSEARLYVVANQVVIFPRCASPLDFNR
jgi:hypothetical protein